MTIAAETQPGLIHFHTQKADTLFALRTALEQKDKYTQAHAQRVAVYSGRLAKRLNLPDFEIHQITMGGMLHDVGKLALSDRFFSQQETALSADMLTEVQNHPVIGAALLKGFKYTASICETVLYHHERIDGTGYPFGLKGDTIPLGARIVSIADCFDAITTDRPYQKRKSAPSAFRVLNQIAGTCLAADLVPAFIIEISCNGMA